MKTPKPPKPIKMRAAFTTCYALLSAAGFSAVREGNVANVAMALAKKCMQDARCDDNAHNREILAFVVGVVGALDLAVMPHRSLLRPNSAIHKTLRGP